MMIDLDAWLQAHTRDRIYRFWVYRKMFTPNEMDRKYDDESFFEDSSANFGFIREAVRLPDGDVLLGFQLVYDLEPVEDMLEYYKLSEIRLAYYGIDYAEYCENDAEEKDCPPG